MAKEKNKKITENEQDGQFGGVKDTLCMCIDIRNSTNFHKMCGSIEEAGKIINNFITEIYVSLRKINSAITEKFVYAGDGFMFVHKLNEDKNNKNKPYNDGLIRQFIDSVPEVENIIKKFEENYKAYKFSAGIGLDIGDCMEVHVTEVQNKNGKTNLYVGSPVSKANKLCKLMPFTWSNEKKYTAISLELFNELNDRKIEHNYELTRSKKRAM
jgi:hypothetical protein